jgi:hypothetical protein
MERRYEVVTVMYAMHQGVPPEYCRGLKKKRKKRKKGFRLF